MADLGFRQLGLALKRADGASPNDRYVTRSSASAPREISLVGSMGFLGPGTEVAVVALRWGLLGVNSFTHGRGHKRNF
jgi:hypothetical protein